METPTAHIEKYLKLCNERNEVNLSLTDIEYDLTFQGSIEAETELVVHHCDSTDGYFWSCAGFYMWDPDDREWQLIRTLSWGGDEDGINLV